MSASRRKNKPAHVGAKKAITGIAGLDEITHGGLPGQRTTLVVGPSGAGKTVLAMQFILCGVTDFDEPGVYMSFEEDIAELAADFKPMGYDLNSLVVAKRMIIDHVEVPVNSLLVAGDYSMDGLLWRLMSDIDTVGARRVVLDGLGALFKGFPDQAVIRSSLDQILRSLKERGVTTIVTATNEDEFMEQGLGRTLSDCVIILGQRVTDNLTTRFLRVVKYRGSGHGVDEFPFLISKFGISVAPITSVLLDYPASEEVVSSGIPKLDAMLGGGGYYRGSGVLLSGEPGTGKTSIAAHFAADSCRRGEPCLYVALEEAGNQIVRNMRSIGLDLEPLVSSRKLRIQAMRPSSYGLETHLVNMREMIDDFGPRSLVIDPLSSLPSIGTPMQVRSMLARLIYFLKMKGITAFFTCLSSGDVSPDTDVGISSLMDTWVQLQNVEANGEINRLIRILKSRGMANSNQVREFVLTDHGVELVEVYVDGEGVKVGSARVANEARDWTLQMKRQVEISNYRSQFEQTERRIEAQIGELQSQLELARLEMEARLQEYQQEEDIFGAGRKAIRRVRGQPERAAE